MQTDEIKRTGYFRPSGLNMYDATTSVGVLPVGTIAFYSPPSSLPISQLSDRERIRQKLQQAGFLVLSGHATPRLSPEEILELGQLPDGAPSSEDLLNETRGEY